jgi:hypothetical protein
MSQLVFVFTRSQVDKLTRRSGALDEVTRRFLPGVIQEQYFKTGMTASFCMISKSSSINKHSVLRSIEWNEINNSEEKILQHKLV